MGFVQADESLTWLSFCKQSLSCAKLYILSSVMIILARNAHGCVNTRIIDEEPCHLLSSAARA
jgi:hypothetical protein